VDHSDEEAVSAKGGMHRKLVVLSLMAGALHLKEAHPPRGPANLKVGPAINDAVLLARDAEGVRVLDFVPRHDLCWDVVVPRQELGLNKRKDAALNGSLGRRLPKAEGPSRRVPFGHALPRISANNLSYGADLNGIGIDPFIK
jgi:hypothetical protein